MTPTSREVKSTALVYTHCSHIWHHVVMVETTAPRTARARARAELTQEILTTARGHLGVQGAAGLSLRAVARDLGMVSSAVYRYFPSRDDLLTHLIIDAYNSLGDAVDVAEGAVAREDHADRWMALAHACRGWALGHPQEWALIYGSPVPGYAAPQDTVAPGTRVSITMTTILIEAFARGSWPADADAQDVPPEVSLALGPLREFIGTPIPDSLLIGGVMARTQLFGHISLELDGQYTNSVTDLDAFFDHIMRVTAQGLGLA